MQNENIGLDIEEVEDLRVRDYTSKGYSTAARVRKVKKASFENVDSTAPSDLERIIPVLKEIFETIGRNETHRGTLRGIIDKLAPYGSWFTLVYTILHNTGYI
jgi:hypothetical protein